MSKRPSSPPPRPRRPDGFSYPGAEYYSGSSPSASSTSPANPSRQFNNSTYEPLRNSNRSVSPGSFGFQSNFLSHSGIDGFSQFNRRAPPPLQHQGRNVDLPTSPSYQSIGARNRYPGSPPRRVSPESMYRSGSRSPLAWQDGQNLHSRAEPTVVMSNGIFYTDANSGTDLSPVRRSTPPRKANRSAIPPKYAFSSEYAMNMYFENKEACLASGDGIPRDLASGNSIPRDADPTAMLYSLNRELVGLSYEAHARADPRNKREALSPYPDNTTYLGSGSHVSRGQPLANGYLADSSMSSPSRFTIESRKQCTDQGTQTLPLPGGDGPKESRMAEKSVVDSRKSIYEMMDTVTLRDDSESEEELRVEPPKCKNGRRYGCSTEALGSWNKRHPFQPQPFSGTAEQYRMLLKALRECVFFAGQDDEVLEAVADVMEIETAEDETCFLRQGDFGRSGYILIEGEVDVHDDRGMRPTKFSATRSSFGRGTFVRTMKPGRFFGEMTMLWGVPRTMSVYTRSKCIFGKMKRDAYISLVVNKNTAQRTKREDCLRRVKMFETFTFEQISTIADALEKRRIPKGQPVIRQGDEGTEFFVVLHGQCVIEVATGTDKDKLDVQEYGHYEAGDLFGELALKNNAKRSATVRAVTAVEVMCLSRRKFERMLGPLDQLQKAQYLHDPRKCIADFFAPGCSAGPFGMREFSEVDSIQDDTKTDWFVVYRPTSKDAISKMLSGIAVGKGLNVKGKSSKKNRLSGFVPFMQICKNDDKKLIEESPADARLTIFYATQEARKAVLSELEKVMEERRDIDINDRRIREDESHDGVWGLDMPEPLMKEVYIMQQDISELQGWETGRKSEPAFMDMNLHAVRGSSIPRVVLFQHDNDNVMNPRGLLIAYAEEFVKPVVSDFDTFTVGSRNMGYSKLPSDQQKLAKWSLERTLEILDRPAGESWTSRWLEVIAAAHKEGFHPEIPKYGFGDATSYRLTEAVCNATISTGAVRHGSECFNFFFPQELDEEFLIIWEGFPDKPWDYKTEEDLRYFLRERIKQGYSFPINPVWPVRDAGWYDVLKDLRASESARGPLNSWFPAESGLLAKIDAIRAEFPDGFKQRDDQQRRATVGMDLEGCERAEVAQFKALQKAQEHVEQFATMLMQKTLSTKMDKQASMNGGFNARAMWRRGVSKVIAQLSREQQNPRERFRRTSVAIYENSRLA